jgi:hypothetical protein
MIEQKPATYNTRWKMPLRDVLHHSGPSAESPGISENSPSCGHFDADDERTWYIGDLQCNNIQDWNGILHIPKEKHIQYILNWVLASSYWLFSVRSGRLALVALIASFFGYFLCTGRPAARVWIVQPRMIIPICSYISRG